MDLTVIQKIAIYALPVIFAITVHEAAHGYAAKYDPFGTLLLPALTVMLGGVLFGWAKPVPVDFRRLRQPKKDMLWVAAAGPASNFVMAVFWAFVMKFSGVAPAAFAYPLALMGEAGITINLVLMVLNLLPLPPLDGGRIAVSLLPHRMAMRFARIERYGFLILIILLFSGVLSKILSPLFALVYGLLSSFF